MSHRTGVGVLFRDEQVQGDRVAAVGTDPRGIVLQHARREVVALEGHGREQIERRPGLLQHRDDAGIGAFADGDGERRPSGFVGGVDTRAQIDQQADH